MRLRSEPLWRCPRCGERFTSRNQWHACGKFDLNALFERSEPEVRALYRRFVEILEDCGPVVVIPQKTRVAFQVRMRFAAVTPGKSSLKGHFVLAAPQKAACFEKVESLSRRNHLHVFRITSMNDFTGDFVRWAREAYKFGKREHLTGEPPRHGARNAEKARDRRRA